MTVESEPQRSVPEAPAGTLSAAYLDLMKNVLVGRIYGNVLFRPAQPRRFWKRRVVQFLARRRLALVRPQPFDWEARFEGRDWLPSAHTMIGVKRLDNLQFCAEDVLEHNVPGDLIEAGVWQGGATIFMRAVLKAHGVTDRVIWVADSFEGLPHPDAEKYPADAGDLHHKMPELAISLEEVKANFERYGLLDEQVRFLKGWFRDTLQEAPIERLAVMRLDGDMYESTLSALTALYPKLSVGGYVIVDDYALAPCRKAVEDYRVAHEITDEIRETDWTGVYWQRRG